MTLEKKPSLAARLFNRYLRMTVKPKPLHLIGSDELRHYFESHRVASTAKGVHVERVDTGPVVGEWLRPQAGAKGAILYLHGGGYVFGSPRMYRSLTTALAGAAGVNVFALSYRLAPESRCPAAIDDAARAYEWLLASGLASHEVVIGGDSAGGGLTLAALQALKARGSPMPGGAFLYSPWTDLAATGASVAGNAASDCTFREDALRAGGARYAGGLDLKDPRVSPLYGDFRGLPPLLVFASASEMLFDDSVRTVEKARAAGVDVRFEPRAGLAHIWPLYRAILPEGREAIAMTAEFANDRMATIARRSAA